MGGWAERIGLTLPIKPPPRSRFQFGILNLHRLTALFRNLPSASHSSKGSIPSLVHQWVARLELRKRGEIPVRRPEFAHAVVQTQRGDARVVNARSAESGSQGEVAEFFEIPGA